MAVNKFTIVDRLEIDSNGVVSVRLVYGIEQDGNVLSFKYHRTVLGVDTPIGQQMQLVNDHLDSMGEARVGAEDLLRLREITEFARDKSKTHRISKRPVS